MDGRNKERIIVSCTNIDGKQNQESSGHAEASNEQLNSQARLWH